MNFLEILLWLLSICIGSISGYYICLNSNWTFFWVGILIIPISFVVLFALWIGFVSLWGKFLDTKKERENFSHFFYWIIEITDKTFLRVVNVGFKRRGFDKMPKNHDYVLVCNHSSNFDQMVLIAALKRKNQPMSWITKPENMSFPIAGPFIHHAGFIPIDRDDPIKGSEAIKKGVYFLEKHQCAMGICPEGTRNKTEEDLLPFHPGSFQLAMWANVPIVVCCLKKTKDIKKRSPWRHTRVYVDIVDIIYPNEYKGKRASEISDRARKAMLEDLEKGIGEVI